MLTSSGAGPNAWLGEERPRGGAVAALREQHVDDLPVLIDSTVEVRPAAGDLDVGLIDEPPGTGDMPAWSGGVDELGREGPPRVLDEMLPAARHVTDRYANNAVEADDGRLKAQLRPMRGLRRHRSVRTIAAGHAFVQNLRRSHYDVATEQHPLDRLRAAFAELATCF